MLRSIVAVLGMAAVGLLVWRLLDRQGYASSPTDDEPEPPSTDDAERSSRGGAGGDLLR